MMLLYTGETITAVVIIPFKIAILSDLRHNLIASLICVHVKLHRVFDNWTYLQFETGLATT